jgi:NADH-ubiquinone oxidoreductase chain 2
MRIFTKKMLISNLLIIVLSNAVNIRRDKSILYNRITFLVLFLGIINIYSTLIYNTLDKGIGLFNNLYFVTSTTTIFHIFIYVLCIIILQLTSFFPRKKLYKNFNIINILKDTKSNNSIMFDKIGEQYKIIEYPLILLFIVIGANLLISSNDIISIFISIELQSYGLYLLCSLYRNSELSTFAGLMYFLLGGLSSCFILLGTSLLYTNTGTTNLDNFYIINNIYNINSSYIGLYNLTYIDYSILIMVIGFLFKISAAPFHFWSPDVYDSIPTIVTTFVTIIAKISVLNFFLELIHYTNNNSNSINWVIILLFSSLLSFLIGSILGLNQPRIKRLLAYSTISHIGFILLAIAINSVESTQAFIFYLMQYSLSNLNAFLIIIAIGYTFYNLVPKMDIKKASEQDKNKQEQQEVKNILNLVEKNNSPLQLINQLKGYFFINPLLAISLCITIYSFVGIPPLVGFFGKQMVLSAALDKGYIFLSYIAIIVSVISAVYYLNLIKQMFFDESEFKPSTFSIKTPVNSINVTLNSVLTISVSALTLLITLFFLIPQEWLSLTNILSIIIFKT